MKRCEDYYKILQVHYLAEPEVIESAYKRLAKKYHPDVNKDKISEQLMQKINRAYEELSNPAKRRKYNLEWQNIYNKHIEKDYEDEKAKSANERSLLAAKAVLDEYFINIMNGHFDFSYELISSIDKQNITKDDFINWQRAVSMVFQMTQYSCKVNGSYKSKFLNNYMFNDIVEFGVSVVEYNTVMDMVENDTLSKMIVLEDGKWKVFIGYEKLQPLISKFKALTGLLMAKSVIHELVDTHSRIDSLTGLMNQRGIIERIENEVHRFDRYGNIFSLVMCNINISRIINKEIEHEINDSAVKFVGEILLNNFRKLDVIGRWGEKTFLLLLPETNLSSAKKAAFKIRKILKAKKLVHNDVTYKLFVEFGTAEYFSSLEESLDRVSKQIIFKNDGIGFF